MTSANSTEEPATTDRYGRTVGAQEVDPLPQRMHMANFDPLEAVSRGTADKVLEDCRFMLALTSPDCSCCKLVEKRRLVNLLLFVDALLDRPTKESARIEMPGLTALLKHNGVEGTAYKLADDLTPEQRADDNGMPDPAAQHREELINQRLEGYRQGLQAGLDMQMDEKGFFHA